MRTLLVTAAIAAGLLPYSLNAQRGGGGARGGAVAQPGFGGRGAQAGRFGNRIDGNWRDRGWNNRNGVSGLGYGWGYTGWGYPGIYSDFGWPAGYSDGDQTPSVVVVMPPQEPAEPMLPPPPPEPAHPAMHDYTWPDSAGNNEALFSIVSKDGVVLQALAVWVQGNQVRYTTARGSTAGVALAAIDCAATGQLNAANKLKLPLPGCALSR